MKPLNDNTPWENHLITKLTIQHLLSKTHPTNRKIIHLHAQGYTIKEISSLLNLPHSTTHYRLKSTQKLLATALDEPLTSRKP